MHVFAHYLRKSVRHTFKARGHALSINENEDLYRQGRISK